MRLIPVIDLKAGEVVRGVGGRREEYRRIETVLTSDITPAGVARAFAVNFPVRDVYVADLDAIAGSEPNWSAYQAISQSGLRLWIDAGVGDALRAGDVAAFAGASVEVVIVGLESIGSPTVLPEILERITPARAAFSLDLKEGRPLTSTAWRDATPEDIAAHVASLGFQRLVVLDLAHVGEGRGVAGIDLIRRLRERFPALELIGGGGVRSVADLQTLADAGCNAVLVASALHDGRLPPRDLASWRVSS